MRWKRLLPVLTTTLLLACGGASETAVGEFYTDWDKAGGCTSSIPRDAPWRSADGSDIDICDWRGEFVWVTYAALWCGTCHNQAPQFRGAIADAGQHARFLTTLTGGIEVFSEASRDDAKSWARRFGFTPAQVVTEGHSTRTVPQHLLLGPDGRSWYRHVGLLRRDEIVAILADFRSGARSANVR
ncbi:MAG: hypothetical protein Q8J78_00885 [Moraxellaceae bacterium]|nr:hypothetical protein [Moraxellaceae bacterium]